MRHLILAVVLAMLFLISGCSSPKSDIQDEETAASCTEPENPYTEGIGHYAGYEWAESRGGGSCNGSSQSFNEGCEEYEEQESEYQECERRKK
jgi:hypothetical protein